MTDHGRRELERRWHLTGSPLDEAALLAERLRVGALDRERLELAAYCWHDAAAHVVSDGDLDAALPRDVIWSRQLVAFGPSLREAQQWAEGLRRFGLEPVIRAGLALSELLLPVWRELMATRTHARWPAWRGETDQDVEQALDQVRGWLNRRPLVARDPRVCRRVFTFGEMELGFSPALMAVSTTNGLLDLVHGQPGASLDTSLERTCAALWLARYRPAGDPAVRLSEASSPAARRLPGMVVASVQARLVEWAVQPRR